MIRAVGPVAVALIGAAVLTGVVGGDLVLRASRALGLPEAVGWVAVAIMAYGIGWLGARWAQRRLAPRLPFDARAFKR